MNPLALSLLLCLLLTLTLTTALPSPFADAPVNSTTDRQRHALFLSVPLPGHLSPLLSLSAALHRRGWYTTLVTTVHMRQHVTVEAPHLTFLQLHNCQAEYDALPAALNASAAAVPNWLLSSYHLYSWTVSLHHCMYGEAVEAVRRQGRRVDVAVLDFASPFAFDVARTLDLPYIVNNCNVLNFLPFSFLPPHPHLPLGLSAVGLGELSLTSWRFWVQRLVYPLIAVTALAGERWVLERLLNEARALSGLEAVTVSEWVAGRLILVNAVMGLEYTRPLPPLIRMTGPLIDMRPNVDVDRSSRLSAAEVGWLEERQRAVYVAFGTIAPLTDVTLRVLYEALAELSVNYTVVWKVSSSLADLLPQPPPLLHMTGWVSSQPSLLCHPHLSLFISHCGTHSAHESLYCGVPILCLPIQGDQQENAQRLADAHAGAFLPPATMTPRQLVTQVHDMLKPGSGYGRQAVRLGGLIRLAGGVEVAAGWVEWEAEYGVEGLVEAGEGWRLWVKQGWDVIAVWCIIVWLLATACRRVVRRLLHLYIRQPKSALRGSDERVDGNVAESGRAAAAGTDIDTSTLRRRRTHRPAG